jgi:hypothetical protein
VYPSTYVFNYWLLMRSFGVSIPPGHYENLEYRQELANLGAALFEAAK